MFKLLFIALAVIPITQNEAKQRRLFGDKPQSDREVHLWDRPRETSRSASYYAAHADRAAVVPKKFKLRDRVMCHAQKLNNFHEGKPGIVHEATFLAGKWSYRVYFPHRVGKKMNRASFVEEDLIKADKAGPGGDDGAMET